MEPNKIPEKVKRKVFSDPKILETKGIAGAIVIGEKIKEIITATK
jgi:hypothetical protein